MEIHVLENFTSSLCLCFKDLAQILDVRQAKPQPEYYVHYVNLDKRMDEWVGQDRFLSTDKAAELEVNSSSSGPTTRTHRRRFMSHGVPNMEDPAVQQFEKEHEEATRIKNIQQIEIGCYEIDCWYFSPYPDEYSRGVTKLYICEKCLKYMKSYETYAWHYNECRYTGPPGKIIYMKDNLAVFELDGEKDQAIKLYCQNLCLLSKLFLDHKTLYFDVGGFFFYVLCEIDEEGTHPVGYFSKEKESVEGYNLACIMVMPPHQKKGYGRFLIQLSYELTKREKKTGSPEKPLSDLGQLSYRSFWTYELLNRLKRYGAHNAPTIADLCEQTGFAREDILETLSYLGLLKNWRDQKVLNLSVKLIDEHLKQFANKKFTLLDPDSLDWP